MGQINWALYVPLLLLRRRTCFIKQQVGRRKKSRVVLIVLSSTRGLLYENIQESSKSSFMKQSRSPCFEPFFAGSLRAPFHLSSRTRAHPREVHPTIIHVGKRELPHPHLSTTHIRTTYLLMAATVVHGPKPTPGTRARRRRSGISAGFTPDAKLHCYRIERVRGNARH